MDITAEGMIALPITATMTANARAKAADMGALRNSIRKGEGNLTGFLGEEVVLAAWDGSSSANCHEYDLRWNDLTFEIKTKDRTVAPTLDYEASVADFNTRQRADYYVFTSLRRASTDMAELRRAASIIGGASDVLDESLCSLHYVLDHLDEHDFLPARRLLRLYRCKRRGGIEQTLSDLLAAVRKTHKRHETQCEAMASFGVDPRLVETFTTGYVAGFAAKADYIRQARFMRAGDTDPSNGWTVSADCYNLSYRALNRFAS